MRYGIAILSIIPVRAEASDRSEMVTQILFGETFEILKSDKNWLFVRLENDHYTGWIDFKHCHFITNRYMNILRNQNIYYLQDKVRNVKISKYGEDILVAGSSIPNFKGKMSFRLFRTQFKFIGHPQQLQFNNLRDQIVHFSKLYLNSPYLWGGRSPFGIDCSGFTQIVYKFAGIEIPRDASKQVNLGRPVDFVNEARPGDLAFFDNGDDKIIHTGIILDGARIIHASGKVRIDFIDHEGINNSETGRYTHHLRVVKNIIDFKDTLPPWKNLDPQGQMF